MYPLILEPNPDFWWLVQVTKDAQKERFRKNPGVSIPSFARRDGNENRPLDRLSWIQERLEKKNTTTNVIS